jgi:NADH-quinone oxidoreductase subunit E
MSNQQILERYKPDRDNLLMILHELQDHHPQHYLTEDALESAARYLNLTKASVYGVATYYTMFSLKPRGTFLIRVCVSAICEMMKSDEVISQLEKILGIKAGETTPCGKFTLEVSECLGQCQSAPSMMINSEVYNDLDEPRIRKIIDGFR